MNSILLIYLVTKEKTDLTFHRQHDEFFYRIVDNASHNMVVQGQKDFSRLLNTVSREGLVVQ